MFVTFFGRLPHELEHTHESPPVMTVPLMLLAVLAVGFGFISFNWPGTFGGFGYFVFNHKPHGFEFTWWIGILSAVMAVGSFVLAYLIYERGSISLESTRQRFASVLRVVENKYYFDEVYQWTIDRIVLVLASFIGFFDRAIVNDIAINGPADTVRWFGIKLPAARYRASVQLRAGDDVGRGGTGHLLVADKPRELYEFGDLKRFLPHPNPLPLRERELMGGDRESAMSGRRGWR